MDTHIFRKAAAAMAAGAAFVVGGLAFAPAADALRLYPSLTGDGIVILSPTCGSVVEDPTIQTRNDTGIMRDSDDVTFASPSAPGAPGVGLSMRYTVSAANTILSKLSC